MATWQLQSCTFTLFQVKEEEQCEPGELCWDEIPSAQLQRDPQPAGNWWRRRLPASSVPQCSSGQGRAAQSAQEQLRSRARSGLCSGCSCTQLPAGTMRTPSVTWRQWHSWCYSRSGWQGAQEGWAQIITHLLPLFPHPSGGSSGRDCIDDPNSIHHLPVTNVPRKGACPQNWSTGPME